MDTSDNSEYKQRASKSNDILAHLSFKDKEKNVYQAATKAKKKKKTKILPTGYIQQLANRINSSMIFAPE